MFVMYNMIMENMEIEEEILEKKLQNLDKKQKEINDKLSKMSEEEIMENMIKSIKESVEYARKNNIEVIDCGD